MKSLLGVVTLALSALGLSSLPAAAQDSDAPDLVLLVSIDQLRGDLVDRYEPAFTGAFRRLLDDGYEFVGASHAHAVTHTAAGHATLGTGVVPARSGIVANSWQNRTGDDWQSMYAVEDRDEPILGFEELAQLPGRSPKNLLRAGLADWIRMADSDARTVSVSSKDRAAITLAGKTDEHVYWLLSPLARFITSTFYSDSYPGWLNRFNDEVMPGIAYDTIWNSATPARHQGLARADEGVPFEGDGTHTTFPHISSQEVNGPGPQQHNAWAFGQSRADRAVLALAETAMDELDLGQRGHTDFLAISLSATDYVGHGYGPLSQEQLSNLVALDRELGAFMEHLDEELGEDNWVMALSGDHGVVTMPEAAQAMGNSDAERISLNERVGAMNAVLAEEAEDGMGDDLAERVAEELEKQGLVEAAYTHAELLFGEPSDSFATLFRNSHYPGRAHGPLSTYGIEVRYGAGDLVSFPTGTTHGSPYWYDRHVPLFFYGAGVDSGSSHRVAYTVDVAPTLAALAGIAAPDDLDGRALLGRQ